MEDWGKIKLEQIDSHDFWCLFDELCDDISGFLNNRSTILEAYKNGNLYGLRVNETDKMYQRGARIDNIFCDNSFYLLPCFCVKENNKAIIIWTHTRARKMGFAKKLVELLHIKYAYNPLPDSLEFWKKCNIKLEVLNVKRSN
jgi:hypothetical protein